MEKFSVSRAPVREALIELCNEKVLYSIPYYGYKITPVTDTDVANVKAYRSVVECGFMQEYWRKLTPDAIERLSAMIKEDMAQKEAGDAITNWNDNLRFHLAFFEIYGNQYAYNNLRSAMSMQTRLMPRPAGTNGTPTSSTISPHFMAPFWKPSRKTRWIGLYDCSARILSAYNSYKYLLTHTRRVSPIRDTPPRVFSLCNCFR